MLDKDLSCLLNDNLLRFYLCFFKLNTRHFSIKKKTVRGVGKANRSVNIFV